MKNFQLEKNERHISPHSFTAEQQRRIKGVSQGPTATLNIFFLKNFSQCVLTLLLLTRSRSGKKLWRRLLWKEKKHFWREKLPKKWTFEWKVSVRRKKFDLVKKETFSANWENLEKNFSTSFNKIRSCSYSRARKGSSNLLVDKLGLQKLICFLHAQ